MTHGPTKPRTIAPLLPRDEIEGRAERALSRVLRVPGVEAAELRADRVASRRVQVGDRGRTASRASLTEGLGVLVRSGGGSAYVHSADPDPSALVPLVERAVSLARAKARLRGREPTVERPAHRATYSPRARGDPLQATDDEVLEILRRAHASATDAPGIDGANATFGVHATATLVLDSAGSSSRVESLLSTLLVTATSTAGGKLGSGNAWQGGERGLVGYGAGGVAETIGRSAAERAIASTRATSVPSGRYRVLCDNELTGTLAHESFGHLTEYDLVASGWSTLRGRRGEQLAPEHVSVTDAPVTPAGGVAVPIDDEGTRGRPVTVLERGRLAAWLHTRASAAEEGDEPCGNGRALDSRFPPIVRMRNTYVEPGEATLEEALEALGDGLYLCGARGGAPYSDGSFMFTAVRGYVVRRGEVCEPVRNLGIHGNIFDFLWGVELLTRDFEVSTNYFGGCGKREQSFLHVGIGGPHALVREALVGGI